MCALALKSCFYSNILTQFAAWFSFAPLYITNVFGRVWEGPNKTAHGAPLNADKWKFWMPQKRVNESFASMKNAFGMAKSKTTGFDRLCGRGDVHQTFTNKPLHPDHFIARWQPYLQSSGPLLGGKKRSSNTTERTPCLQASSVFVFHSVSTCFVFIPTTKLEKKENIFKYITR